MCPAGRIGALSWGMSMTPEGPSPAGPIPTGGALPQPPPGWQPAPLSWRPRRRVSWLALLATVLAAAALVLSLIAVLRPAPAGDASAAAPAADTTAADKALCEAIAPLMGESRQIMGRLDKSGPPDSQERVAALPVYTAATKEWVAKMQPLIDAHPNADPFFRRSLQRVVDDSKLLALDLAGSTGRYYNSDDVLLQDAIGSLGGPMNACAVLGVKWW